MQKSRQPVGKSLNIRTVADNILDETSETVPESHVRALATEYIRLVESNRLPNDPLVKFRVNVFELEQKSAGDRPGQWYCSMTVDPHGDDDEIFSVGPYTEAQARQIGRNARERLGLNQKFRVNLPDGSVTDIEAEDLRSCLDEVCKLVGADVLAASLTVKRL
jgi:hypothetical protein